MNPSTTIREIAAQIADTAQRERLEVLASQFELQHNQQNNNIGVTIGQLQLRLQDEIRAMRFDFEQELGNSEARQKTILEMLEQLQQDIRALAAGNEQPK